MLFVAGTIFGFDFAQRILAALEAAVNCDQDCNVVAALASELRAVVERK